MSKGDHVNPSHGTVAEFLNEWLDGPMQSSVRLKTADGYRFIVRKYIAPRIGQVPLRALQPAHLQGLYSGLLALGLSATTTRHAHAVIRRALAEGVRTGRLGRNVALATQPPRSKRREMSTLSVDEVRRFLTAAQDSPYYAPFVTLLWTGARRGEVLALRWRDIDLLLGTISITRSMYVTKGAKKAFEEPKSQTGRRQVAMPPSLAIELREHHKRMEQLRGPLNDNDLVFTWEDGRPMLPDSITHAFKRIALRLGLDGIRLHDLRHSHATLMLEQGIHPKVVSERLGHANISITLDIYSHVMPGIQQAAAETFDQALSQALPGNGAVDKTQEPALTNG